MEKKPEQIFDTNLGRVFPPPEAVVPQLASIRSMATSAINVYEATEDIHSVQPNLDTIQRIVDYLRGAPIQEGMKPAPEDILKPTFNYSSNDINFSMKFNKDGEYDVELYGIDVEPNIDNENLFGRPEDLAQPVLEVTVRIPVTCYTTYEVTQINPALEMFKDDPTIHYEEKTGKWIKQKEYYMDKDYFDYSFLVTEGRNQISLYFEDESEKVIGTFNIKTHIHFKEKEEEII